MRCYVVVVLLGPVGLGGVDDVVWRLDPSQWDIEPTNEVQPRVSRPSLSSVAKLEAPVGQDLHALCRFFRVQGVLPIHFIRVFHNSMGNIHGGIGVGSPLILGLRLTRLNNWDLRGSFIEPRAPFYGPYPLITSSIISPDHRVGTRTPGNHSYGREEQFQILF